LKNNQAYHKKLVQQQIKTYLSFTKALKMKDTKTAMFLIQVLK